MSNISEELPKREMELGEWAWEECEQGEKVASSSVGWIATFADLMSLLLVFFVLMLSYSNSDKKKFVDASGSLSRAFGTFILSKGEFQPLSKEKSDSVKMDKKISSIIAIQEEKADKLKKELISMIYRLEMGTDFNLIMDEDGVRLIVSENIFFRIGEARLSNKAIPFLEDIAMIMDSNRTFDLTVEGHTDNIPIRGGPFPSNWSLSSTRASSVIEKILEIAVQKDYSIREERFTAIGRSSTRPIVPNLTEEQRAKNRRVDFIFMNTEE